MSEEISVPDNVKEFIDGLVKKYNISASTEITYNRGSEIGDGFMSKTYAVDINDSKQPLNLFLKCALDISFPGMPSFLDIYSNEICFYESVVPKYMDFLNEKGITDGFRNVPKCYGSAENKILALENLRRTGYELCDKTLVGNEEHIELVFKTYAKYHAIGFVYKEQKPEEYSNILQGVTDLFRNPSKEFDEQRVAIGKIAMQDFFKKLDPKRDKFILDQSQHIVDKLIEFGAGVNAMPYANPILIQGDCWCNNMMFKYDGDKRFPVDVMLLDWQAIRPGSPALDLSYLFYTTAAVSKKMLRKVDDFLELYHEELSKQIRKMGCDPDALYSLSLLKKEWHTFCKFGFSMAFLILKAMLGEKEEMSNFEKVDMLEAMKDENLFGVVKKESEYMTRMKNLAEHFLLSEFL
ncbi:hypothetical protein Trydic_g11581 [Trypoxylus dichotomus]